MCSSTQLSCGSQLWPFAVVVAMAFAVACNDVVVLSTHIPIHNGNTLTATKNFRTVQSSIECPTRRSILELFSLDLYSVLIIQLRDILQTGCFSRLHPEKLRQSTGTLWLLHNIQLRLRVVGVLDPCPSPLSNLRELSLVSV